jgi:hypothetical protein
MTRERLPNRRQCWSFEFEIDGLRYTCSYGRFPDGRLAEIFLNCSKAASQANTNAQEAAIAASIALQSGSTLDELRKAVLRNDDGTASTPLGGALDLIAKDGSAP